MLSSTSTVRSLYWDKARGRTAQVASSSFLNEYSCSNFSRSQFRPRGDAMVSKSESIAQVWERLPDCSVMNAEEVMMYTWCQ
jgi:hypothetical protein